MDGGGAGSNLSILKEAKKIIWATNGILYYYNYDFSNIYELTEILISLNFFSSYR